MIRRLDEWQRRHRVPGFGYAVVCKYFDDGGPREAALITYYGFLGLFPVLLLAVTIVSEALRNRPELRHEVIDGFVPASLRADVDAAVAALPTSSAAWVLGVLGLAYTAAGVVLSAYFTLNHLAAVPWRDRTGYLSRYLRVLGALAVLLAGIVGTALLPAAGAFGTAFLVLWLLARLLLDRPAPLRAIWPAALAGAGAVTLMLELGAALLPRLVRGAGPVYGGFATVAGFFTLLYLLSNALVLAAEVAAVRWARLWPRALDPSRPTAADLRVVALLKREQERFAPAGTTPPPDR
ncbi:YhjD/YihY/BrkB family envelope integrity protein [Actinoplanes oblitus]|uniref:YhjD/YihY/BrkB family envelope integrity protein n=1 Tax=Actinoplanes oblitus TaxID=3040509 RepID=A0ABY8WLR3_9ACTN|nr:YhjD/YihY/BrkB family envelope integrity protein [Actinoplanes oblitus]WIM98422.1 YhjD/YihY/BrkB family envelope integrity protein [Actinoplanes oblitus]